MKLGKPWRAAIGVALIAIGFVMARGNTRYRESRVVIGTEGCHLVTDVVDRGADEVQGFVVLFHGLSANKKIMQYIARGFAEENLRVFVPDLPGHGRSPGPFSFERAESCADNFVRELTARRAIEAKRTVLAGHSMGGAIAIRVGARVPNAGVIAISPAPMRAAHGVPADMLPYRDPPPLPAHTLVMAAAREPLGIRELAQDLVAEDASGTSKFLFVPRASHVSVLFDPRVAKAAQEWVAQAFGSRDVGELPSSVPGIGSVVGLIGILLLAGPFVREMVGKSARVGVRPATEQPQTAAAVPNGVDGKRISVVRVLVEISVVSFVVVALLRIGNPLAFLRLFNGSYFASFLLIAGLILLLVHGREALAMVRGWSYTLVLALIAGVVLHFLVTMWFDATSTEAWLTAGRWARLPVFFVAALAAMLGEEVLLGNPGGSRKWARVALAMVMRALAFGVLVFGIFVLHSGAILMILLALFLALFSVFQRMGVDLVRRETGSGLAAAVFGAILLAGFCLVIFPVT